MCESSHNVTTALLQRRCSYILLVVLVVDDDLEHCFWDVASLPEQSRPQLDADDPEDEEDEEAEEEDVTQHGQGVQQQHHEDAHT